MQIPNLPHDNFYKFLAFAGLAVLIAANYLFYTMEGQVLDTLLTNEATEYRVESDKKASRRAVDDWLQELRKLTAANDREGLRLHEQKWEALLEKYRESSLKAGEQVYKKFELENLSDRFRTVQSVYWIATILGFVLMTVGCLLWYRRIQVPQDQLIKRQIQDVAVDYLG